VSHLLSTRRVFVIIFFLGILALPARGVYDPDVWWHLRSGQEIVHNHAVPRTDIFSYTRSGEPWITHEWLSEIVLYTVYRSVGFSGLTVLFALVIASSFLITYLRCEGRPYVAAFVVLLGAAASAPAWGVRPQMFSLLLAAIFLALLQRAESSGNYKILWWMLPIQLLWVNLHAGYAVGLALIFLTLVGWCLELWLGGVDRQQCLFRLRTLALVLAACGALVVCNPNGLHLYTYPFQTLQSRTMMDYIAEWASPNFHEGLFKPFLAFLLLTFATLSLSRIPLRPAQLLLLLATGFGSLNASRHIAIFILVAIPLVAERLTEFAANTPRLRWLETPDRPATGAKLPFNALILLAMVLFVGLRFIQVFKKQTPEVAKNFPVAAADFIAQHHPPAPVFNHYDWGGFLIWRLYPTYRVFIDGRADLYGDSFMDTFASASRAENNWREPLQRFGIRTVVIPPRVGLAGILRHDPGWKTLFEDEQAVIFTQKNEVSLNEEH
jgi:hypothetical protein